MIIVSGWVHDYHEGGFENLGGTVMFRGKVKP